MVAVPKCEMAAASQKKVFSHPGAAWEDSEIITGSSREASVNCAARQRAQPDTILILSSAEYIHVPAQEWKIRSTFRCGTDWGGRGDMAIKREIESGGRTPIAGKS